MSEGSPPQSKPPPPPRRYRKRWWRRVRRVLLYLILLAALLLGLLQLPAFQDWLARRVAASMSQTLETKVSVDSVRLSWFDELTIGGLYVEDKYGDTLLYGSQLRADFDLFSLLDRALEIEEVAISDTRFNIRRDPGDAESNLTTALRRLFPPRDGPPNDPIALNLDRLELRRITFVQDDSVRGQRFDVYLDAASVAIDTLDLARRRIAVGRAELRGPNIQLTNFSPDTLGTMLAVANPSPVDTNRPELLLTMANLEIIDGAFGLDNFRKEAIEVDAITAVDFARLGVRDIGMELVDVRLAGSEVSAAVEHLSLAERSGFVLDHLGVQEMRIAPTELVFNDLELVTPGSRLSDSLSFSFPGGWSAWSEFNDRVSMTVDLEPSRVAIRDLLYFARTLRFNPFFRNNRNRTVALEGKVRGRVNNLRAEDVGLALGEQNYLEGNFSSRNLSQPDLASLNLRLDRLSTSVRALRQLLPQTNIPPNFDKLGRLNFDGRFDGFFTDFAAFGRLNTDIGSARLDMRMDIENGVDRAEYGGQLSLENFDLGRWTDNAQLGNVNFVGTLSEGRGLEATTAAANLDATIQQFTFRGYTYANARIDGRLEQQFFNGSFEIADDNIDLRFLGELDFRDSLPTYDFAADIDELDLQALNLSERAISLSGEVDLNLVGAEFSEMEGRVALEGFRVVRDTSVIEVGQLLAYSNFNAEGQKVVRLDSDIARGEIVGSFDLDDLTASLRSYFVSHYPGWADRLNLRAPAVTPVPNRFSFDLTVVDSRGLNRLLAPQLAPLRDVQLVGSYDGFADRLQAELLAPTFGYGPVRMVDLIVRTKGEGREGELDIVIDSTYLNGNPLLEQLTLLSLLDGDTLNFGINYGGQAGLFVNKINLNGQVSLPDSGRYAVRFDESDLVLFEEPWSIRRDNYLVFGPAYIDTRNFSLRSGQRRISVTERGERGIDLMMENMPLGLIDSLWDYQPLDFGGQLTLRAGVDNLFDLKGISVMARSDTFLINGDDYGYLRADIRAPDPRGRLTAYLNLNRDTAQLIAEATYNLGDLSGGSLSVPSASREQGYLDLTVSLSNYPLDLASYWVGGSVSDIAGRIDGQLDVVGPAGGLTVGGYIDASPGAFTIDFLQTRYRFGQSRVRINNTLFDLDGTRLYDRYNNVARVYGGITHDRLKDLGIRARLETDRFLALDLAPGQNPTFFGQAIGGGTVTFSGDFRQPDVYVRAAVGRNTRLSIPASEGAGAGPIDNVRFVNRSVYSEEEPRTVADNPIGISLDMEIEVTDEAVGEIIFDEEVGDILRGRGNGNLTIRIPRDGDLRMFGTVTLTEGDYLFTLYRVVNKEFEVRPGGTVTWTGDPFAARIDIAADYQDLKTPVLPFVQEYLPSEGGELNTQLSNQASQATDVDLTLKLSGILTQPSINFDIAFPNLDGRLENYANNKRQQLLLDQNELNRQVFGLIAVGQFLPSDLSFNVADVAVNTVSEWLSSYLSLLLNNLVSDAFGEESFISGFDFDIAYNNYTSVVGSQGRGQGQAVEFSFRRDFSNRLSLRGDVNVLNNQFTSETTAGGTFIGNDVVLEYALNDARTLKLRVYQRRQPDIANGRRVQVGTGLSWQREFDTLSEFFGGLQQDVRTDSRK